MPKRPHSPPSPDSSTPPPRRGWEADEDAALPHQAQPLPPAFGADEDDEDEEEEEE